MTHLTLSAAIRVPNGLSEDQMKRDFENAWICLRRKLPGIACRSSRADDLEKHYVLRYIVPGSEEDLKSWISETVFFTDCTETLEKLNTHLKDDHWWKQSENRYVTELHVSPSQDQNEWHVRCVSRIFPCTSLSVMLICSQFELRA